MTHLSLNDARMSAGKSIAEAAADTGISYNALTRYEARARQPSHATIQLLSDYYKLAPYQRAQLLSWLASPR